MDTFFPLFENVTSVNETSPFARFIQTDHVSDSEIMKDVCDGTYIQSHPLMVQGKFFLQFVISYDDLELQSPSEVWQNAQGSDGVFYIAEHPTTVPVTVEQYIPFGFSKN